MVIIGERINSSRKSIADAIENRDSRKIQEEAKHQVVAGANYIDVNAGTFVGHEVAHMKWLIETVQGVIETPLCIDSPDPNVIREVMPLVEKPPLINSISLEPNRLNGVLPILLESKAKVIGLCQSEHSIADSTAQKVELTAELVEKLEENGVLRNDIYIDPLIYPLATNPSNALFTLEAIERIMKMFTGIHTVCGLTNISHGLPNRKLINLVFLVSAVNRGLDTAILDPTDNRLFGALKAALMVMGKDEYCMEYISAHREGRLE